MFNWLRKKKWVLTTAILVTVLLSSSGIGIADRDSVNPDQLQFGIGGDKVITLGHVALASTTVDYTFDGVADDIQFQAALDALPATGGKLVVVSASTIVFANTVSRAIDDVTIEGTGDGTYFTYDAASSIFDTGVQDGWRFSNFRTDVGGLDVATATNYRIDNVTIGTTFYPASTRTATIVVAANDATVAEKAQADFICSGANDEVQLALANTAAGSGLVRLSSGTFTLGADWAGVTTLFKGVGLTKGYTATYYGTRINAVANQITCNCPGNFQGLTISGRNATPTPTLLMESLGGEAYFSQLGLLENVEVRNAADDQVGIGVKFEGIATNDGSRSFNFNCIGPLAIGGYEYGLWIYINKTGVSPTAWNENTVRHLMLRNNKINVRIEAIGTTWMGVNDWHGIYMNGYAGTTHGIQIIGGEGRDSFFGVKCQDWANCPTAPLITIPSGSVHNYADIMVDLNDFIVNDNSGNSTNVINVNNEVYRQKKLKPNVTRWVLPGWFVSSITTQAVTADRIYYTPIYVEETTTYIRIGIQVTTGAAGTADLRIFEFDDDGLPGALILSAGSVDTAAIEVDEIVIAEKLRGGRYYFLAVRFTGTPTCRVPNPDNSVAPPVAGFASIFGYQSEVVLISDAVYADPATAPTDGANANYSFVNLREN